MRRNNANQRLKINEDRITLIIKSQGIKSEARSKHG